MRNSAVVMSKLNLKLVLGAFILILPTFISAEYQGVDSWCAENCSDFKACSEKFQDDFVDLQVNILKQKLSHQEKYDTLFWDLLDGVYFGNTIARQTFETQFILDVSTTIGVSPCRLYIRNIYPMTDFDIGHVGDIPLIVTFRFYPAEVKYIKKLTKAIQEYDSRRNNSVKGIIRWVDPSIGLVVHQWDLSLKLMYNINVIGYYNASKGYFDEGSKRLCGTSNAVQNTLYCEFESYFRNDLGSALSMVSPSFIQVLLVQPFGRDSVLIKFRFIPSSIQDSASWISMLVTSLSDQVSCKIIFHLQYIQAYKLML